MSTQVLKSGSWNGLPGFPFAPLSSTGAKGTRSMDQRPLRVQPRSLPRQDLRSARAADAARSRTAGEVTPAVAAEGARPGRLPVPALEAPDRAEGRMTLVLAILAAAALFEVLWTAGALATHWERFVELACRVLG